jgi:multidrug efflux system outer membrane protein
MIRAANGSCRIAKWMATCALPAMLASCVAVPPQPPRDVALPGQWRGATETSTADAGAWWHRFHDARLDQLVSTALAENLSIAEAGFRLHAARTQAATSDARFRPALALNALPAVNVESTASYFQVGFDATWELGLFGRARSQKALARADADLGEIDTAAARVVVIAEVARQYVELRAAQARVATQAQHVEQDQAAVARAQRAEQLGLGSTLDSEKSRSEQALDEARLETLRHQPEQHAQALARLLGRTELDESLLEPGALPVPPEASVPPPADLLRTRPEIRRAEAEVARAAAELGIAEAELLPQIGLGGTLTYASKINGDQLLSPRSIVSIGPSISIPLFDWGLRRASALAHGDLLSAAVLRYRQAVVDGAADVQTALSNLAAAQARLTLLDGAATRAKTAIEQADRLRELGLADASGRADAQRRLGDVDAERIDALAAANLALIALYKSLGGAVPSESAR